MQSYVGKQTNKQIPKPTPKSFWPVRVSSYYLNTDLKKKKVFKKSVVSCVIQFQSLLHKD